MRRDFTPEWIERFWSRVDRSGGPDACWEWQGARKTRDYGQLGQGPGKPLISAHRAAFLIANGEIPDEAPNVLHSCDNPPCCNPAHLRAGTFRDNNLDIVLRGRTAHGYTKPSQRKVTDDDAVVIRTLASETTLTYKQIGERYGVSATQVWRIVRFLGRSGNFDRHLHDQSDRPTG
jgi:hypothetical protein